MPFENRNKNENNLRVIKTARNKKIMNEALQEGMQVLVKKVEPSAEIKTKYSVLLNKKTGKIEVVGDYRMTGMMGAVDNDEYKTLIDWSYYYPYHFSSPFAAYIIPPDIQVGERVFIEDLIEDYIGSVWSQGSVYRLDSCEAIWNGSELDIQYDPNKNKTTFIG